MCVCVLYTGTAGFFFPEFQTQVLGVHIIHMCVLYTRLYSIYILDIEFVGDSFSTFFRDLIFCPKLFDYIQVKLGFLILCGG